MNRQKISMVGAMLCVLGLGFSDTAKGQTLTASPSSMTFNVQSGGATSTQTLSITASNGATTLFVSLTGVPSWLTVNNTPPGGTFYVNTPTNGGGVNLPIAVNTAGLISGDTYNASFTVQINGLSSSTIIYPVTLVVGTPSVLMANPTSLTFSATQGASFGSPNPATVAITSSEEQLNFNISVSTLTGGNWLLLSTTTGISGGQAFQVYVNPQAGTGLSAGTYTGTIYVQSTTTGDSVSIQVQLIVTAGSALNVTGTLNNFVFQAGSGEGSFSTQQQELLVSTNTGNLNYSVTTYPAVNWLVLSTTGSLATTTPQAVYLSLSYQAVVALSAGTYTTQLTIEPTGAAGAANATTLTVTLIVTNNPLLNVNTNKLSFSIPFGSTSSQTQTVTVTSSNGTSVPYSVQSNQQWLYTSPTTGTTGANPVFTVFVSATGLAVSTTPYVGTLIVQPNNTDQGLYSLTITVSLTVTSATTTVYAGPSTLLFSYQTTKTPPIAQDVQLTATGTVGFSVSTTTMAGSNCPSGNWLNANPNQFVTPATLAVSIATSGMASGFCTGTVIVTYDNGVSANTTVLIPVTVDISGTALLTVSPPIGFGVVTATYGSTTSIPFSVSINSTDGSALGFTATASTPNAPVSWLFLGSSSGTTQQYLQVQISPNGLPVGVYNGSITISANNSTNLPSGALTIPVVLTVSASTTVTASPLSLSFAQIQGASTAPAAQTITLTPSSGGAAFLAAVVQGTGGNWLQITPLSGTLSSTAGGTISASVALNTLSPGTYTSNVTISFQNSATPTVTIPVTLTVTAAPTVAVAPASLNFSYQLGSSAATPATATLNVTSTTGIVNLSAVASSTPAWLAVTPGTGSAGPGSALTLTASVVPGVLTTAGTFTGTITITPTGQTPIPVTVTLTVTGVPVPQPVTISNSASGAYGAIAPGELITIKGTNIGPSTSATFSVGSGNTVSNILSGVQVLFDNIPGTPTYVSATQINVIVPYDIAGRVSTNVVVSYQNEQSAGITETVVNQAPGIYTFSATGAGQASVLNQNFTFNGPAVGLVINGQQVNTTPAAQGSVIAVYMTGGGQTNPVGTDGTVTPTSTLYNIPVTVSATVNGVNAPVLFAGAAPGLVTGVVQVNLQVPTGVTGNGLSLVITINGVSSPIGPTVAVQ